MKHLVGFTYCLNKGRVRHVAPPSAFKEISLPQYVCTLQPACSSLFGEILSKNGDTIID